MPQDNSDLKLIRKQEIINACASLYEKISFKEITIKEISKLTSFTRTSIYNYFQTKEEIFLALLQREYELLNIDMQEMYSKYDALSLEDFADKLAKIFDKRHILLKIVSMNHYDMESCSRLENIVEFKKVYGNTLNITSKCIKKFFVNIDDLQADSFIYAFFPFLFGVYPYTAVTEKQRQAMDKAGIRYKEYTPYMIIYNCIKQLLLSLHNS